MKVKLIMKYKWPSIALLLIVTSQFVACNQLKTKNQSLKPLPNTIAHHTEKNQAIEDTNQQICLDATSINTLNLFQNPSQLPQSELDFWQSIAPNFCLSEQYKHAAVNEYIDWYNKSPNSLKSSLAKAQPFLYLIAQQIKQKNMPPELLFLPIVESNFEPYAYSHGAAAGIWQMINITADRLGLMRNWWYDGRRDIVDSTQAALDYLEFLHNEFDGDWLLAVAAYNAGEGTVGNAIKANKKKGLPTDFWHLKLPRETKAYVPKWLAVSKIITDAIRTRSGDYQQLLPYVPNKAQLTGVEMKFQIDLKLAAKLAGISLRELYQYNPGYNHWATPPEGPHSLLLPKPAAKKLIAGLKKFPKEKRVSWLRYKIKPGDSLGKLARRYQTTVDAIRSVNHLNDHTIVAGKSLVIPKSSNIFDNEFNNIKAEDINQGKIKLTHIVKSGDSFWKLGKQYHVSGQDIAALNQIDVKKPLKVGQKLTIWYQTNSKNRLKQDKIRPEVIRKIFYPVRTGDSLASIAKKFNLYAPNILKWNLKDHHLLKPGEWLTLYIDVTQQFSGA